MARGTGQCLGSIIVCIVCLGAQVSGGPASANAALPEGVRAVWDVSKAYHETTPTRERICINGLWRWQPAEAQSQQVPAENWGYFKVPGCWPGIGDYMQKDSQTIYPHPSWAGRRLGGITAAWYERQITIPADWAGRHIAISVEYLNSLAIVYVDSAKAGEVRFPGGEADLTSACHPGGTHRLSLLVVALPLKGVMLSYTDSASAREVKAMVQGALARAPVDLAVSITGIAGPGGATSGKPVGLVYFGIARKGGTARVERHTFQGDRATVRAAATERALELLLEAARSA